MNKTLPALAAARVLLVDDDEFMLEFIGEMIAGIGVAEVVKTRSGKTALTLLAEAPPHDILMCDLGMPGMDGVAFLRHAAMAGFAGSVVIFSGRDNDVIKAAQRVAQSLGLQVLAALHKPFDEASLLQALLKAHEVPSVPMVKTELTLSPQDLAQGLREGRLELLYQPKVALRERRVTGVECLVRWRHPQRGLLTPKAFLPNVEQCGLIDQLTLEVLRRAAKQVADWQRDGTSLQLAINLSQHNLRLLELPELLSEIVTAAGLAPEAVVLEITEAGLQQDAALRLDILTRLRLLGFGLSLDDFGTGFATLEMLQTMPFTELKIDSKFVNSAAVDERARTILESSAKLGRQLGLLVVAEGVETAEEWDLATAIGCDAAQGYLIAQPRPPENFLKWLRRWQQHQGDRRRLPQVLVVDDDPITAKFICDALRDAFQVRSVGTAAEAMEYAQIEQPQAILLDVGLPDINGYMLCQQLHDHAATTDIPVIFISSLQNLDNRLQGYLAGGVDYLTKPIHPDELEAKINHVISLTAKQQELRAMARDAQQVAMTAMMSLGEMGVLLEALKQLSLCRTYDALAAQLVSAMSALGVKGLVQVRAPNGTLNLGVGAEANPLEIAIISRLANMERLIHFKSRMSINYDHVSLLVSNMPVDDEDRSGRLRDSLAMLAESAQVCLDAMLRSFELERAARERAAERRSAAIEQSISRVTTLLWQIDEAQRSTGQQVQQAVMTVLQNIEQELLGTALSEAQENHLMSVIREGMDFLTSTLSRSMGLQNQLTSLVGELRALSGDVTLES